MIKFTDIDECTKERAAAAENENEKTNFRPNYGNTSENATKTHENGLGGNAEIRTEDCGLPVGNADIKENI